MRDIENLKKDVLNFEEMFFETIAILAELTFKVLEATVMLKNDFTKEEVINYLVETAESINQTYQINKE
jgi:hypothetical protein